MNAELEYSVMQFAVTRRGEGASAEEIRDVITHLGTGRCMVEERADGKVVHVYTHRDADLVLRTFGERVQPLI